MAQLRTIIITDGQNSEVWTSLARMCRHHEWSYNYLKTKKYPHIYKGLKFDRVNINEVQVGDASLNGFDKIGRSKN